MQWILQDVPLGKNIKRLRKARKLTQEAVATQLQLRGSTLSRGALANIEGGRRNIKASDLKGLKLIFDVEYDEFFRE